MSLFFSALNTASTRFSSDDDGSHKVRTHFGQHMLYHSFFSPTSDGTGGGGRHVDEEILESIYRKQGDQEVDAILELRHSEGRPLGAAEDLIERAAAASAQAGNAASCPSSSKASDQALARFYQRYRTPPTWVDPASLARGQQVFLAYAPAMALSLYYRSLVPGFGAIPKIAAVLQATAYLAPPASPRQVQKRLMDTGAFLAAVTALPVQELLPGGEAWKATLQVRILHAKVRRALLQRSRSRSWNVEQLGVPINQEDMAATLMAFGPNTLVGCEIVSGRPLPVQERLDYLHLWRYVGWLIGVEIYDGDDSNNNNNHERPRALDPCGPGWYPDQPDPLAHSVAVAESLLLHLMHPDPTSVRVAHHLLRLGGRRRPVALSGPEPTTTTTANNHEQEGKHGGKQGDGTDSSFMSPETWFYFRALQCRRFVGDPLADAILLPLYPAWSFKRVRLSVLTELYWWILRLYTWASLPWSPLRRIIVEFHRGNLLRFWNQWQRDLSSSARAKGDQKTSCPFAMVAPPK